MKKPLKKLNEEPDWYQNDRLIQDYLNRFQKTRAKKEDRPANKSSWWTKIHSLKG
jgi:hypothetical protein